MYQIGAPKVWTKNSFIAIGLAGLGVIDIYMYIRTEQVPYAIALFAFALLMAFYLIRAQLFVRRAKKQLRSNQLICPGCGVQLCEIHEDMNESITCFQCAGTTTKQAVLDAWLRVPEYRFEHERINDQNDSTTPQDPSQ